MTTNYRLIQREKKLKLTTWIYSILVLKHIQNKPTLPDNFHFHFFLSEDLAIFCICYSISSQYKFSLPFYQNILLGCLHIHLQNSIKKVMIKQYLLWYRQWVTSIQGLRKTWGIHCVYLYNQSKLYKETVIMNLSLEKLFLHWTLLYIKNFIQFNSVIYTDKTHIAAISRLLIHHTTEHL